MQARLRYGTITTIVDDTTRDKGVERTMTPMDLVAILGITFAAVLVATVMAYVLYKFSEKH
ncbi:hypothetical protein JCM19039_667 [Geomicrobium sp. JCM 19039]|nr:hypothetical protein JCM19039_667 [Geomicrobium sp. JCM 19039]